MSKRELAKQFYITLKDNLSTIILLPTIIGGLWQLLELASISTSFIRFFSLSQLVADGLLILFVLSLVYFSFKLSLKVIGINSSHFKLEDRPMPLWNGIFLVIICSVMFGFTISSIFEELYKTKTIHLGYIFILIPGLMMTIGCGVVGLWRIFINVAFRNRERLEKLQHLLQRNKSLSGNISYFLGLATMTLFIFLIKFILVDLNPYFTNFRQYLIFPANLYNKEILDKKIVEKYNLKYKPVLIYNNDKYFFYRINEQSESKILILNFSDLVD